MPFNETSIRVCVCVCVCVCAREYSRVRVLMCVWGRREGTVRGYQNRSKRRLQKASLNKPWNELRRIDFIFLLQFCFPPRPLYKCGSCFEFAFCCCLVLALRHFARLDKKWIRFLFYLIGSLCLVVAHSPMKRLLSSPLIWKYVEASK